MIRKVKFLPKDVYDIVLEWAVIPTFDILIEYGNQGFIFVKRTIAPYKNVWAFPGLRMMKREEINDTLERIIYTELGLRVDFRKKIFLGQYVGKFQSEHKRQDLSTGFFLHIADSQKIRLNKEHFSAIRIAKSMPKPIGSMYEYYFDQYQKFIEKKSLSKH